jgi:hypothetical protein
MSLEDRLKGVLGKLMARDKNQFFHFPVVGVEQYDEIIKHPMCFEQMQHKMATTGYRTVNLFSKDFVLICDNCCYFNAEDTPWYKAAEALRKYGLKLISKLPQKKKKATKKKPGSKKRKKSDSRVEEDSKSRDLEISSGEGGMNASHDEDDDDDGEGADVGRPQLNEQVVVARKGVPTGIGKLTFQGEIRWPGFINEARRVRLNVPGTCTSHSSREPIATEGGLSRDHEDSNIYVSDEPTSRRRENKNTLGAGLINDMQVRGGEVTLMDVATLWHRDATLLSMFKQVNRMTRQELHLNKNAIAPVFYTEQAVFRHLGVSDMNTQYTSSITNFTEGLSAYPQHEQFLKKHLRLRMQDRSGTVVVPKQTLNIPSSNNNNNNNNNNSNDDSTVFGLSAEELQAVTTVLPNPDSALAHKIRNWTTTLTAPSTSTSTTTTTTTH